LTDIIATIDAATEGLCACGCGTPLDAGGPSAWWASELCQERWQGGMDPTRVARRAAVARTVRERRAARHLIHAGATSTYNPEQVAAAMREAHRQLRAFAEALRPAFEHFGRALADFAGQVQRMERAGIIAPESPVDPMERALWLRRNRNTGPALRRHAPRRIDPTRAR
jgi:hypothetical protein